MTDKPEYQNDEINLMDYIKVIIKRKMTIIGVLIICVVASTIVSFRMPKVYQINSTVRIGSISGSLFTVNEAIEKLKNRNLLQSIVSEVDGNITIEGLKNAIKIESIKDTSLLKLQMESTEPNLAINILDKVEKKFISESNEIFKKSIAIAREEFKDLEERKASIKEEMKELKQKISKHKLSSRFSSALNSLVKYEDIYESISKRESVLKKHLSMAKSFEIIEQPVRSINPIKPNKRQMVTMSAIFGLILGVFAAFFIEFWQKYKTELINK